MPLLTPALDTGVGLERTTAQLVDIEKMGENYSFSFAGLRRWIEMCLEEGVRISAFVPKNIKGLAEKANLSD